MMGLRFAGSGSFGRLYLATCSRCGWAARGYLWDGSFRHSFKVHSWYFCRRRSVWNEL